MLADLASRRPDTSPPESSPYKSQKPLKVLPEERPNYKICLAFVSKAADSPPKNIVDGAALAIAKAPRALRDLQDGPWNLPPHLFLSEFGIKRLMSKSFGKNLVRLSNEEPNYNTALGTLGQTARERRKAPRRKRSIRWKPSDIAKTIDEIRKRRSKCRRSQEPLAYHEELQRQPLKPPVPAALPQQQMPATLGTPAISHRLPDADDHECEDHDGLDSGSDERLLEAVSSRNRKLSFSAKSAATRRSPRSKVASDQDSQSLVKPMSLVPSQRRKSASLLNKETGKTAREILTTRNGPEFEHVPVEEWSDRSDILAAPRSSLAAGQSLSGGTLMELIQSFNPDHEHNLVLDPVTIDTTCQAFRPRCHIWPTIGRIVIPIDDPQRSHWALGIGNLRARCIQIFDSIPDDQRFQTYAQTVQSFIERHYEHRDGVAQWSHEQLALSSRQRNGFDCGLYVTIVAACQMNGLECPPSITSNLWRRCFLRIFGKCNDFRSPMADFMLPSRPSPTGRRFDLEIAIANEERIKADMESIRQLRTETALAARILAAGEDGFKKIVGQKIMLQSTLKWADEMPNHYPMQQLIDPVVDRVQELKRHAKSQILLVNALEARIEGMYAACELCRTDLVELDRLLIEQRNQHLRVSRSVDVLMEGYAERHRTAQVNEDS